MKKTITLILVNAVAAFTFAQTPNLAWAKTIGSTNIDFGSDIVADSDGNVYSTGGFYESIIFHGPQLNVEYYSNGEYDFYINKYSPDGALEWAHLIGGALTDQSHGIALDSENNVYVCGEFRGTVDFNPGPSQDLFVSSGESDGFITKYSSTGDYLWTKTYGGSAYEVINSICIYDTKLFIGGSFSSQNFGLTTGPLSYQMPTSGGYDGLLIEMTTDGMFTSAKQVGGLGNDEITSMRIDSAGDLYVAGSYSAVADLDPSNGVDLHSSLGLTDAFVLKMTENGQFLWASTAGGMFKDMASDVAVTEDGGVVIAGGFQSVVDFNPSSSVLNLTSTGGYDCFLQKLDGDGNLIWAKTFGGLANDIINDIVIDSNGELTLSGSFEEEADLNPGPQQYNVISNGLSDGYILRLDHNGEFVWSETIGNSDQDSYNSGYVDSNGDMYFTGFFNADVDFEPGIEISTLSSEGLSDAFIQKLQMCSSVVTTQQVTACGSFVWLDGSYYEESTNTPIYVTTTVNGCDSIIHLDLEVINVSTGATLVGNTISADQVGADSYQWIDCNTGLPIDGETNQEFTPQAPGTYAAIVSIGQCPATTVCVELQLSGLENNLIDDEFMVYPNPSYGEFVVKCPENKIGEELTVLDSRGSVVYSGVVSSATMNLVLDLDAGLYMVKFDKLVERIVIK